MHSIIIFQMQNDPLVQDSHKALNIYIDNAPTMLSSVDDSQYIRLQNKYKHLILRYINDYNALQKLKQIERQIPEIILRHPKVIAQMRGIAQIKNKLYQQNLTNQQLTSEIRQGTLEREQLLKKTKEKKEQLILEKREYMKLRKAIDDIEAKESKPLNSKKYTFQKRVVQQKPIVKLNNNFVNNLDLFVGFKVGMKAMQKKEFKTIGANIETVLKNIRIKRNILEVDNMNGIVRKNLKTKASRLLSTKCTSRQLGKSDKQNGPIYQRAALESRETDEKQHDSDLMDLNSIELYSRICMNKQDLETFTTMLNDLMYKNKE